MLDGFKTGLGTEVLTQCRLAIASNAKEIRLQRSTWNDLRDWSKTTFMDKTEVDVVGLTGSSAIKSYDEFVGAIIGSVGIGMSETVRDRLKEFYEANAGKYLTAIFVDFQDERRGHELFIMATADGAPFKPTVTVSDSSFRIDYGSVFKYVMITDFPADEFVSFYEAPNYNTWCVRSYGLSGYPQLVYTFPIVGSEVQIKTKLRAKRGYYDDVIAKNKVLVTPGTRYRDRELLGDVTLPFPADLSKALHDALNDVISIPDIFEDVNVYPVDDDLDAIEDAISKVEASVKEIEKYKLSFAEFFPFCIPFDFVDFINVLKADPIAPEFTFKFPVGYDLDEGVIYQDYTISLSQFDQVAYWCRQFELLAFIIGLIVMTRPMFIKS